MAGWEGEHDRGRVRDRKVCWRQRDVRVEEGDLTDKGRETLRTAGGIERGVREGAET